MTTTPQGGVTIELVPYEGETSELKKLSLVISGENKTKKINKSPDQRKTEEKC